SSLFLLITFASCTNDQLPEPAVIDCPTAITYIADIKAIIDNSCSYAGCHVSGFGSGDFTSFSSMQGAISSGAFEQRVIEQKNMPPSNAPDGRPTELTAEELELVRCWIKGGYLEN
ncbi:MAG: hypothetical protein ACI9VN_002037, partial [Patescibacteria group bacterium]